MPDKPQYEAKLQAVKKAAGKAPLHTLNILPLLPFKPAKSTNTGRRFNAIVIETINEQLSEKDLYAPIGDYQYLMFLGANEKLARMKIDLINKEIARKIELFVQEKYLPAPELEDISTDPDLRRDDYAPTRENHTDNEKWRPEVEPLPRKVRQDSPEKKRMADQAMLEMLRAREEKNLITTPHRLSRQLEVSYVPVWNVPRNHLTAFIARPRNMAIDPENIFYAKEKADLDIALLIKASAELNQILAEGNKVVLIVPVSLLTLDSYPSRNLYLQYCRELIPEAQSLIVLKIEHIDQSLSIRRLDDILREPVGLVRSMILTSDLKRKYEMPRRTRIHGFSVSLRQTDPDERKTFRLLDRFGEQIQEKNKASMVEDIPTTSLLCAAIGAGASYVSGVIVQPPQSSMDTVKPFDLAAVYEKYRTAT
jgi:hypothetical protein